VSPSTLGRAALVAGALVVLGVLAVQLYGQVHEDRAGKAVELVAVGRSDPALVRQAHRDLRAARRLRPDGEVRALDALLLAATGRLRAGEAVARRLVHDEPENFDGWSVIYLANLSSNREQAHNAKVKALELNPLGAETLIALASLPAVRQARRDAFRQ
jgi:hypothetical protein